MRGFGAEALELGRFQASSQAASSTSAKMGAATGRLEALNRAAIYVRCQGVSYRGSLRGNYFCLVLCEPQRSYHSRMKNMHGHGILLVFDGRREMFECEERRAHIMYTHSFGKNDGFHLANVFSCRNCGYTVLGRRSGQGCSLEVLGVGLRPLSVSEVFLRCA